MKQILTNIVVFSAVAVLAQEEASQSGTPAKLEAINGKQVQVFLQSQKDGIITFQPRKSTRNISVGSDKVKSLTFFLKYDEAAVDASYNAADYQAVNATLSPLMEPFWEYMIIDNNLRKVFCSLMDANRELGKFSKVREAANLLLDSGDETLEQRGLVNLALVALAEKDIPAAEKIQGEVSSEAAALYLQASIERANEDPKSAIQTVTKIITDHANDIDWLAPSELLCAYLYMDMIGSNSVITTNSALNTARQVKNIYSGTHVAADAEKFWASLGGAEIEAAAKAERIERMAREKEAEEKRKADEKARKEAEAAAQAVAAAAAAAEAQVTAETNLTATAEMESE